MKTSDQITGNPRVPPLVGVDGRHALRDNLPSSNSRKNSKNSSLKRSRRMVIFWLKQKYEPQYDTLHFTAQVANYQAKLKLQELDSALKLLRELESNVRARSRFLSQYRNEHPPRLRETQLAEKRRIGVGYRDKGALRPHNTKGRDLGEPVTFSGDIQVLLPHHVPQDIWLTRSEVVEHCGGETIYQLSLISLFSHKVPWFQLFSNPREPNG